MPVDGGSPTRVKTRKQLGGPPSPNPLGMQKTSDSLNPMKKPTKARASVPNPFEAMKKRAMNG